MERKGEPAGLTIAIIFQDDRYFLSGSLDGKLRLWNIPDKRVALWNEIESVGETMGPGGGDIYDGLVMSCDIT